MENKTKETEMQVTGKLTMTIDGGAADIFRNLFWGRNNKRVQKKRPRSKRNKSQPGVLTKERKARMVTVDKMQKSEGKGKKSGRTSAGRDGRQKKRRSRKNQRSKGREVQQRENSDSVTGSRRLNGLLQQPFSQIGGSKTSDTYAQREIVRSSSRSASDVRTMSEFEIPESGLPFGDECSPKSSG